MAMKQSDIKKLSKDELIDLVNELNESRRGDLFNFIRDIVSGLFSKINMNFIFFAWISYKSMTSPEVTLDEFDRFLRTVIGIFTFTSESEDGSAAISYGNINAFLSLLIIVLVIVIILGHRRRRKLVQQKGEIQEKYELLVDKKRKSSKIKDTGETHEDDKV